jgi:hypothetical protein
MHTQKHSTPVKAISAVNALLAVWLILSPWILGGPGSYVTRTGITAGALILVCTLLRATIRPSAVFSAVNVLLAGWVVVSPWLSGALTEDARTWSYVIAGAVIAVLEVLSLTVTGIRHPGLGRAA